MAESGPPSKPESDIYTVLVIVATVFSAAGTVVIALRSSAFFESWLPI